MSSGRLGDGTVRSRHQTRFKYDLDTQELLTDDDFAVIQTTRDFLQVQVIIQKRLGGREYATLLTSIVASQALNKHIANMSPQQYQRSSHHQFRKQRHQCAR